LLVLKIILIFVQDWNEALWLCVITSGKQGKLDSFLIQPYRKRNWPEFQSFLERLKLSRTSFWNLCVSTVMWMTFCSIKKQTQNTTWLWRLFVLCYIMVELHLFANCGSRYSVRTGFEVYLVEIHRH